MLFNDQVVLRSSFGGYLCLNSNDDGNSNDSNSNSDAPGDQDDAIDNKAKDDDSGDDNSNDSPDDNTLKDGKKPLDDGNDNNDDDIDIKNMDKNSKDGDPTELLDGTEDNNNDDDKDQGNNNLDKLEKKEGKKGDAGDDNNDNNDDQNPEGGLETGSEGGNNNSDEDFYVCEQHMNPKTISDCGTSPYGFCCFCEVKLKDKANTNYCFSNPYPKYLENGDEEDANKGLTEEKGELKNGNFSFCA